MTEQESALMAAEHGTEEDDQGASRDAIVNLLRNYHSLNANVVDELLDEPSALEFMRYVSRNRPFVIRHGAQSWPAYKKWDASYLRTAMGEAPVKVVITPNGFVLHPLDIHSSN